MARRMFEELEEAATTGNSKNGGMEAASRLHEDDSDDGLGLEAREPRPSEDSRVDNGGCGHGGDEEGVWQAECNSDGSVVMAAQALASFDKSGEAAQICNG